MTRHPLNHRDFLKISALDISALAFRPFVWQAISELQQSELWGRVTVGKVDVYVRPDASSQIVGVLYEGQVVPWIREVVESMPSRINNAGSKLPMVVCRVEICKPFTTSQMRP